MKQRFDWRSGGAAYLGFVSILYVLVGTIGIFTDYPPLAMFFAMFLTVNPYPLLYFGARCALYSSCTIRDMGYDMSGTGPVGSRFASLSVLVVFLGLLGLVALFERSQMGRRILFALSTLATITAISNCVSSAISIHQGISGLDSSLILDLSVSCGWALSYWIALSRIRFTDEENC
jgi:hypothetical protein